MRTKNAESPALFRTYPIRGNASDNCFIWEAARATTAAITFFEPINICGPDGISEEFTDGGLMWNNPVKVVIEEGARVFGPDRRVACVLSIGTGHQGSIGLGDANWYQPLLPKNAIDLLKKLATDCEQKAAECEKQYSHLQKLYYRFNVDHGLENMSMADWKMLSTVKAHTKSYLQKPSVGGRLDEVIDVLRTRRADVTAAQLCMVQTSSSSRM
jgi:predicted acylesterase/phospholipase RssA